MHSDEREKLIREVVGLKVKLDNLCNRFDELATVVSQDHDTLVRLNGKFKTIESWVESYRKDLDMIRSELEATIKDIQKTYKKDLDKIKDELEETIKDIQKMQSFIDEQRRVWLARITIWASIISAVASIFISKILTHIR